MPFHAQALLVACNGFGFLVSLLINVTHLQGSPGGIIFRPVGAHFHRHFVHGNGLVVRGLHAEFQLPGEDPSLYPEVPDFAAEAYHVVTAANLRKLIRRTMFATDVESTRYALGGVLVELTPETITMVGTMPTERFSRRQAATSARRSRTVRTTVTEVVDMR